MGPRTLLVALVSTLVVAACCTASAWASSPNAFDDDFDAALAASGDTQWLVVGGVDKSGSRETYGVKVFERSGAGPWQELPPLPGKDFNSSDGLHIVLQGASDPAPCVSYPVDAGPRLECLRDGKWEDALGSAIRGVFNVGDLIAPTPDSLAVIYKKHTGPGGQRVLTYVARSDSGGPWRRIGKPFEGIILAQFEEADTPGPLRVGIENMKRRGATRYVAEESGGQWVTVTPLDHTREGPFVGGPINIAGARYFPLTDAGVAPFRFGVLSLTPGATTWLEVGGGPLSPPTTAGQGSVAIVDGTPWAIWQEDTEQRRSFKSKIRIADLSLPTVAPITLWSGKRIGPGPVEFVDVPGPLVYALYARGTDQGLRIVVDEYYL